MEASNQEKLNPEQCGIFQKLESSLSQYLATLIGLNFITDMGFFKTDQCVLFVFCTEHYYIIVFIACERFNVTVHVFGPTFKCLSQPKVLETILVEIEMNIKHSVNI